MHPSSNSFFPSCTYPPLFPEEEALDESCASSIQDSSFSSHQRLFSEIDSASSSQEPSKKKRKTDSNISRDKKALLLAILFHQNMIAIHGRCIEKVQDKIPWKGITQLVLKFTNESLKTDSKKKQEKAYGVVFKRMLEASQSTSSPSFYILLRSTNNEPDFAIRENIQKLENTDITRVAFEVLQDMRQGTFSGSSITL